MTEETAIPPEVKELLRRAIHSIEELEILLVLRGAVMRSWTAEQLARELRLPEAMAASALQSLVVNKLALQVGIPAPQQYQYRLQPPEGEEAVAELVETYAQYRLEVLMQISSNAIERVREGALRTFADAFRFRGGRRDD